MPQDEIRKLEDEVIETEKKIEEVAEKLEVKLPKSSIPFLMKIITLIMIAGGLSILGSVFTDFVVPQSGGAILHFYRFLTGLIFLAIAYGIYDRRRWALWLYLVVIILFGLILNLTFALVPILLVIYLYTQRRFLRPGVLDKFFLKTFKSAKVKFTDVKSK